MYRDLNRQFCPQIGYKDFYNPEKFILLANLTGSIDTKNLEFVAPYYEVYMGFQIHSSETRQGFKAVFTAGKILTYSLGGKGRPVCIL